MKISIIFAILLISSTFAAETENPLTILLSQVSEHPFGNALGSLIQLHMKNDSTAPEGKINAILKILEQLGHTISTAQANAETRYESKAAWCADTIEQLEREYEAAKKASANSAAEYNSLDRERGTKKNDLTDSTTSKSELREDLEKAQTDLQSEETQFQQRFADYTEAIAACQEAIRMLLQLGNRQPGAVFIQMNQNFGKVRAQLEEHAKNTESAFIEPILDVLSQLANGAQYDYSTITNIVDLVRSLLKNLQAAQQELESNHGKVEKDLETLIANLANQLETVQVNVDVYDTRLSEIDIRMNELKPLINQYETLAEVNGKMLEGTKATCADNDKLHAEQQAAREKQLATIAALETYFRNEATGRN